MGIGLLSQPLLALYFVLIVWLRLLFTSAMCWQTAIEILRTPDKQVALAFAWRRVMCATQVGIKYGGKGEVDVTGLEMELREPYKV